MKKSKTYDIVTIAIVAALYVILTMTPGLSAISYGPIQFRVSEMLNFTAFFNKKYIIAVTIGCMISNFLSFTWVDVIVGGLSTLVFLSLGVLLFDRFKKDYFWNGQLNKAFLLTWGTLALGEFASLFIGAFVMDKLGKRVDLSR